MLVITEIASRQRGPSWQQACSTSNKEQVDQFHINGLLRCIFYPSYSLGSSLSVHSTKFRISTACVICRDITKLMPARTRLHCSTGSHTPVTLEAPFIVGLNQGPFTSIDVLTHTFGSSCRQPATLQGFTSARPALTNLTKQEHAQLVDSTPLRNSPEANATYATAQSPDPTSLQLRSVSAQALHSWGP